MISSLVNSFLVTEEQLMDTTGYTRRADLVRHLNSEGVQFRRGQGGCVYTTVDAISFYLRSLNNQLEPTFS
jgi:hypothetical protein